MELGSFTPDGQGDWESSSNKDNPYPDNFPFIKKVLIAVHGEDYLAQQIEERGLLLDTTWEELIELEINRDIKKETFNKLFDGIINALELYKLRRNDWQQMQDALEDSPDKLNTQHEIMQRLIDMFELDSPEDFFLWQGFHRWVDVIEGLDILFKHD